MIDIYVAGSISLVATIVTYWLAYGMGKASGFSEGFLTGAIANQEGLVDIKITEDK